MKSRKEKNDSAGSSQSFKTGAIALAFLIVGYQAALFMHRASALRIQEACSTPDTVIIYRSIAPERTGTGAERAGSGRQQTTNQAPRDIPDSVVRRKGFQPPEVKQVLEQRRRAENFTFNPNTVSVEDLQRLGFSEKQALAIDSYRAKGGRFRRKSDFAASFVVADSVYRRLERYIDIPKVDINRADSAEFDTLPGIGGWFASRMVEYREALGGYSYPEQLMDIYHFDKEKYDALSDLICCSPPPVPFAIWTLPADALKSHPYIRSYQTAKAIVLFREHNPPENYTVDALEAAGIIDAQTADRLRKCVFEPPNVSDDGT